jgi:hypothetical protein
MKELPREKGNVMSVAHTAVSQEFETTQPITLKGQVAQVLLAQESYLRIEVKDATGKSEIWAVQGDSVAVLMRAGWSPRGTLRLGDEVTVIAFRPKGNADVTSTLKTTEPSILEAAKTKHVLRGTEVTLPNGKKLIFSGNKK